MNSCSLGVKSKEGGVSRSLDALRRLFDYCSRRSASFAKFLITRLPFGILLPIITHLPLRMRSKSFFVHLLIDRLTELDLRRKHAVIPVLDSKVKFLDGAAEIWAKFLYFQLGAINEPLRVLRRGGVQKDNDFYRRLLGDSFYLNGNMQPFPDDADAQYRPNPHAVLYIVHTNLLKNTNGYATRTHELVSALGSGKFNVYPFLRPSAMPNLPEDYLCKQVDDIKYYLGWSEVAEKQSLRDYVDYASVSVELFARKVEAGIIHAASSFHNALPAFLAAKRLGIPFIYEVRGLWGLSKSAVVPHWQGSDRYRLSEMLDLFLMHNADEVVTISESLKRKLITLGVPDSKISMAHNSVDVDKFQPLKRQGILGAQIGLHEDDFTFGFIGSLVDYEGLEILLVAAKQLLDDGLKFKIVIIGEGASRKALQKLANSLGIQDSVIFTGAVPYDEVTHYYSLLDVLVYPRRDLEVCNVVPPLKPLEALALEKTIIVSDVTALRELVIPGVNGFTFARDSSESLANIMRQVRLGELRLSSSPRDWVSLHRSWSAAAERLASVYERCLLKSTFRAREGDETTLESNDLRIGLIADDFTRTCLEAEFAVINLTPANWKEELIHGFDLLLVESAWKGVKGAWERKIGWYEEEKCVTLAKLVGACRKRNIPTCFFNKEDPVHFERFKQTAELFDHVFTTDNGSVAKYIKNRSPENKTFGVTPFAAQQNIHNPVLSKDSAVHCKASYAGTFYGARYVERTRKLEPLLEAAMPHGLTIFDRQLLEESSPYQFPDRYRPYIEKGLTYEEMLNEYKKHSVTINVNSVESSLTMMSRRVLEATSAGSSVVSSYSKAMEYLFGDTVDCVHLGQEAQAVLNRMFTSQLERKRKLLDAQRIIWRQHTWSHRVRYILGHTGIAVKAHNERKYVVILHLPEHEIQGMIEQVEGQSLKPQFIYLVGNKNTGSPNENGRIRFFDTYESAITAVHEEYYAAVIKMSQELSTYYFEDLLHVTSYAGECHQISYKEDEKPALLRKEICAQLPVALLSTTGSNNSGELNTYLLTAISRPRQVQSPNVIYRRNLLIAGHDMKFISSLIEKFRENYSVFVDEWSGHNSHDESVGLSALDVADVIFCEWALGNLVFYSNHKRPSQRLIVRFHRQELETPYPIRANLEAVDQFIFVSAWVAEAARQKFKIPRKKIAIVPNFFNPQIDTLSVRSGCNTRYHLGMVGITPRMKRFDLALDLLERLRRTEPRYRLFIKGHRPEEYSWIRKNSGEMEYYRIAYQRIESTPELQEAVVFEDYGDDMASWYKKIGVILSLSDYESFHLSVADGAAAGCIPSILRWPGFNDIYPADWARDSLAQLQEQIESLPMNVDEQVQSYRDYVTSRFDISKIQGALESCF